MNWKLPEVIERAIAAGLGNRAALQLLGFK